MFEMKDLNSSNEIFICRCKISVGDKHFQISEAIELSLWSIDLSFLI